MSHSQNPEHRWPMYVQVSDARRQMSAGCTERVYNALSQARAESVVTMPPGCAAASGLLAHAFQLSAAGVAPKAQPDTLNLRSAQAHSGLCLECSPDADRFDWCITPSDPARLTVIDGWPGVHGALAAVNSWV